MLKIQIHIIIIFNFKYNKADDSEQNQLLLVVDLLEENCLLVLLQENFSCETWFFCFFAIRKMFQKLNSCFVCFLVSHPADVYFKSIINKFLFC